MAKVTSPIIQGTDSPSVDAVPFLPKLDILLQTSPTFMSALAAFPYCCCGKDVGLCRQNFRRCLGHDPQLTAQTDISIYRMTSCHRSKQQEPAAPCVVRAPTALGSTPASRRNYAVLSVQYRFVLSSSSQPCHLQLLVQNGQLGLWA